MTIGLRLQTNICGLCSTVPMLMVVQKSALLKLL